MAKLVLQNPNMQKHLDKRSGHFRGARFTKLLESPQPRVICASLPVLSGPDLVPKGGWDLVMARAGFLVTCWCYFEVPGFEAKLATVSEKGKIPTKYLHL